MKGVLMVVGGGSEAAGRSMTGLADIAYISTLLYNSPPHIKPLFVWQKLKIPSFRIYCA